MSVECTETGHMLSRFQDEFARALFAVDPDGEPVSDLTSETATLTRLPGFTVYRNTVIKGCVDALQANYPSIARLVGDEWFRAAATIFARSRPPREASLLRYGEDFAGFLETFEPAADMTYLADVARLDRFWAEAHVACDDDALDAQRLASIAPEVLAGMVLHPHASARWAWFAAQPIYTIWKRNREAFADESEIAWHGEGALVVRPRNAVVWTQISHAAVAFLDICAKGGTLADAASAALEIDPGADLSPLMSTLIAAGAFGCVTLHNASSSSKESR